MCTMTKGTSDPSDDDDDDGGLFSKISPATRSRTQEPLRIPGWNTPQPPIIPGDVARVGPNRCSAHTNNEHEQPEQPCYLVKEGFSRFS